MAFIDASTPDPIKIPVYVGDSAGGDLTDTYPNPHIQTGAVTQDKLAPNSVGTNEIQDGAITAAKLGTTLAAFPITDPNDISSGLITNAHISSSAFISTSKLAEANFFVKTYGTQIISGAKVFQRPITYHEPYYFIDIVNKKYVDQRVQLSGTVNLTGLSLISGSGTNNFIAKWTGLGHTAVIGDSNTIYEFANQVGIGTTSLTSSAKLTISGNLSIIGTLLGNGIISGNLIAANSILTGHLANASVSGNVIAANSILNGHIQDSAISGNKVQSQSILNGHLANASISGNKIAANSILQGHLADSSVGSAQIINSSISGNKIQANSILQGHLADNSVGSAQIINSSISGNKIQSNSILQGHVSNGYVDLSTNQTVSGTKIFFNAQAAGNPINAKDLTDKEYVDALVAAGTSPTGNAGGDLTGTYPNPTLRNSSVSGNKIAANSILQGHVSNGYVDLLTNQTISGTKTFYPNLIISGKLFVTNGIDPEYIEVSGKQSNTYISWTDGATVPVSTINTARIIYNKALNKVQVSEGTLPYVNITPSGGAIGGSGLANKVAKFSGPQTITSGIITDDGSLVTITGNFEIDGQLLANQGLISGNHIIANSILQGHLANNSIGSNQIINSSISGNKIAANSILQGHIQDSSIGSNQIIDNSITNTDLQNSSVSGNKIQANSILQGHLADNSVGSNQVIDNSITNSDLQNSSVSGNKIAANSILQGHLANNSVGSAQLIDNSVSNSDLLDSAVSGNKISANSILNGHLASNIIANGNLQSASVSGNAIATPAISQGHILSGYVDLFTNQSVSGTKIFNNKIIIGNRLSIGHSNVPTRNLELSGTFVLTNDFCEISSPSTVPAYTLTGYTLISKQAYPYIVNRLGLSTSACDFRVENGNASQLFNVIGDGNIGFGTATPNISSFAKALTIYSNNVSAVEHASSAADATSTYIGEIEGIFDTNSAGHKRITAITMSTSGSTVNQRGGDLAFWTKSNASTSLTERMIINSAGNVGVNNHTPLNKLDVSTNSSVVPQIRFGLDAGDNGGYLFSTNDSQAFIMGGTSYNGGYLPKSTTASIIAQSAGAITFYTDASLTVGTIYTPTLRMTIATNGAVSIVGALSKGSGTFKIDHPLDPENKNLYHGFVEAPRYDLIYRGVVDLIKGEASVNIDLTNNMTDGTFVEIAINAQCWLQNDSGWDRVKGKITGNMLNITCENTNSTDTINWMIIAERDDPYIHQCTSTINGKLKVEEDKPDPTEKELEVLNLKSIKTTDHTKVGNTEVVEIKELSGKKGYPIYPQAIGQAYPTKEVKYVLDDVKLDDNDLTKKT